MIQRIGELYHWQPTTMADAYKMPPAARNPRAPDGTSPGPKSAKRPASRRTDPNTNAIISSGCIIEECGRWQLSLATCHVSLHASLPQYNHSMADD